MRAFSFRATAQPMGPAPAPGWCGIAEALGQIVPPAAAPGERWRFVGIEGPRSPPRGPQLRQQFNESPGEVVAHVVSPGNWMMPIPLIAASSRAWPLLHWSRPRATLWGLPFRVKCHSSPLPQAGVTGQLRETVGRAVAGGVGREAHAGEPAAPSLRATSPNREVAGRIARSDPSCTRSATGW